MPSRFAALVVRERVVLNLPRHDITLLLPDLPDNMLSAAGVHSNETAAAEVGLPFGVVFALVNVIVSVLGLTRFANGINLSTHQIDVEFPN